MVSALTLWFQHFMLDVCPENDPARLYLPVFPVRSWPAEMGAANALFWVREGN
jgi:hypothetical protein